MEKKMIKNLETIKKGTRLITKQLGVPTRATALESIKQGRGLKKVLLVDVKGSDVGMFDEIGSVYVSDIVEVL
tara:strand:- start:460 stop:678 length:219 start_codon:yes stop_codon:yes gene_type:complete